MDHTTSKNLTLIKVNYELVEKEMKVKLLTNKEREEMDREIAEQEEQEKENEASPKQTVVALIPKSAKRRKPSGHGSQTHSQAKGNEGSDVEFL